MMPCPPTSPLFPYTTLFRSGCTHKIVGRDYAGVGGFYDIYAAQGIFEEFTPEQLGIDIRTFNEVFFCVRCNQPTTDQSCPHDDSRSEEHTSELQSRGPLVCRLLL